MKKIVQFKLKWAARAVLAKYKPIVIGVTGSVGKTGTKEAVYTVVATQHRARRSRKNYNNEIGVPLSIIGADSPARSVFGWLHVALRVFRLLIWRDKQYPEVLVLEMGVDRPGDMSYLTGIACSRIGVVTAVGASHLQYFGSVAKIRNEKAELIRRIPKEGWSVLNADDEQVKTMANESKARVITYGMSGQADIQAKELKMVDQPASHSGNSRLPGLNFKLSYQGAHVPVFLPGTLGDNAVYSALAGAAVGVSLGMNLVDVSKALANYQAPPGRMRILEGIKHTLILDDTYNSSPQSSLMALGSLKRIELFTGARRFAVLGDMLELGSYTAEGHREVGKFAVQAGVDELVVVGERSVDTMQAAKKAGMAEERIFHFDTSEQAGRFVQDRIKQGDLILVKGSQGMRMEKVVKEIMAEPLRAEELLVRQGPEWKNK
jgi:UDP-N-acetylmuramoyl-tripeptide--D-alanyl-D-alanine ligase